MPRTARKRSESGFYHAIEKGDGSRIIFENARDRELYVRELEQCAENFSVKVHAYCLMSNHVHLLLQDDGGELSAFMKRLGESYARYHQRKTGRSGHLFNGRFWSEGVDNEPYFLSALRYIHANPEPPGICRASDYPWSSYRAYVGDESFVTTELALSLLGGVDRFKEFQQTGGAYAKPFKSSRLSHHHSEDELAIIALALLGRDTLNNLGKMPPKERRVHIERLYEAGFTVAEITRVTGIGRQSILHDLA